MGALHAATHGDHHVYGRNLLKGLRASAEVSTPRLLQKAHGIWVDCAGRVRACGTGVDFVWSKRVGQGLRHLAATGVVRADKGDAKRCEVLIGPPGGCVILVHYIDICLYNTY